MEFPSVYPSVNLLVIKNIITEGYTDIMKRVIFLHVNSVSKSIGNNIFLSPTDLPTDKKLPMKDSPTEHFHR
jgi:hypothetical protein